MAFPSLTSYFWVYDRKCQSVIFIFTSVYINIVGFYRFLFYFPRILDCKILNISVCYLIDYL